MKEMLWHSNVIRTLLRRALTDPQQQNQMKSEAAVMKEVTVQTYVLKVLKDFHIRFAQAPMKCAPEGVTPVNVLYIYNRIVKTPLN